MMLRMNRRTEGELELLRNRSSGDFRRHRVSFVGPRVEFVGQILPPVCVRERRIGIRGPERVMDGRVQVRVLDASPLVPAA